MNEPLRVSALARSVGHDFVVARRGLIVYEFAAKLLETWLLVPALAMVLALVLDRAGHIAVSNQDILDFLLTPFGLLYAALFGTVGAALLLLEQAGIMVFVAAVERRERGPGTILVQTFVAKTGRLFQLGAIMLVALALTWVPFLLLAIATYRLLLSQHDIYYYINARPPVFWVAAGIGGVLSVFAMAVGAWLFVRWALALPILVFEEQSTRGALRASVERVRGFSWQIGLVLIGWLVGALVIGAALEASFRLVAASILAVSGERPVALILGLVVLQGGVLATWSFVTVVGLGLLVRRLYLLRIEQLGPIHSIHPATSPVSPEPIPRLSWPLAALSLLILLVAPFVLWFDLSRYVKAPPKVQVTAHRGHARAAPENTLSAMRKAVESGADYAEMDVQETADGVIVLLHDRDLKRVAGVSRRLEEMPYDEVRKLDVGSWFDPAFASERIPTLEEVINQCRGRIRLNIELKFFGPNRQLAADVARLVHKLNFESECLITSLQFDGLQEVKRHNPRLRTGLIVAHALGDVSRLETEALSVRADFLSDHLLRSAHRNGLEVHVWTVNEAGRIVQMIKRGVDNVITSDPDLAVRVRNEWANLSGTERLVLTSRLLLGLNP
jgi:glycerophosphoryl diester phosphodiesterase